MLVSTTADHVDFENNNWEMDEEFLSKPRGFFADQFEVNPYPEHLPFSLSLKCGLTSVTLADLYIRKPHQNRSNFDAHFSGTGPEIWRQTNGEVDAFVSGAGTGGTLAGTGRYLKTVNEDILVALSDPEGSGLFNKVGPM